MKGVWVKPKLGHRIGYSSEWDLPHAIYVQWSNEVVFYLYRRADFSKTLPIKNTKYSINNGYKPVDIPGVPLRVFTINQIGLIPKFWWLDIGKDIK